MIKWVFPAGRDRRFHSFGDGAAQAAVCPRKFPENLAADLRRLRGRGGDRCAIGPHDLTAEGLLLIGDLDHIDMAVHMQVCAGHGEGRAPLAGARLRRDAGQALLLGVIGLGDGGIQLMTAAGVVALKFVVDFRRGP